MAGDEARGAWQRFESEIQGLVAELKRHYRDGVDEKDRAALNRSLEQLREAAESVFKSLETATQDPELRSKTKQAARSLGSAVAETFRDLSDVIEKRVRRS